MKKVPCFGKVAAAIELPPQWIYQSDGWAEMLVVEVFGVGELATGKHRFRPIVELSDLGLIGRFEDGRFFEVTEYSGTLNLRLLEPETEKEAIERLASDLDELERDAQHLTELPKTAERLDRAECLRRGAEDLHLDLGSDPIVATTAEGDVDGGRLSGRAWLGGEL